MLRIAGRAFRGMGWTALVWPLAGAMALWAAVAPSPPAEAGITGSRHDLSSGLTDQVCLFCHTPHFANLDMESPLWNRVVGPKTYSLYTSGTMDTIVPGAPNDTSLVCLGCHDGTLTDGEYMGYTISDKHDLIVGPNGEFPDLVSYPNCENCHPDVYGLPPTTAFLGTDLTNDHPISISYPTPAEDPDFNTPPDPLQGWWTSGADDVKLYDGNIECATCHNVHDPTITPFLRVSNAGSNLCLTCHIK